MLVRSGFLPVFLCVSVLLHVQQWFSVVPLLEGKRGSTGLSARRGSRLFGWRASRLKSGCKTRICCLF